MILLICCYVLLGSIPRFLLCMCPYSEPLIPSCLRNLNPHSFSFSISITFLASLSSGLFSVRETFCFLIPSPPRYHYALFYSCRFPFFCSCSFFSLKKVLFSNTFLDLFSLNQYYLLFYLFSQLVVSISSSSSIYFPY